MSGDWFEISMLGVLMSGFLLQYGCLLDFRHFGDSILSQVPCGPYHMRHFKAPEPESLGQTLPNPKQ